MAENARHIRIYYLELHHLLQHLVAQEFKTYVALLGQVKDNSRTCCVSYGKLAQMTQQTRRNVMRIVQSLVEKGYIKHIGKEGTKNKYEFAEVAKIKPQPRTKKHPAETLQILELPPEPTATAEEEAQITDIAKQVYSRYWTQIKQPEYLRRVWAEVQNAGITVDVAVVNQIACTVWR